MNKHIFQKDNFPICVRDNATLFEEHMTSSSRQTDGCDCPADCEGLTFQLQQDARRVLPKQECLRDEVLQAAMRNIKVAKTTYLRDVTIHGPWGV